MRARTLLCAICGLLAACAADDSAERSGGAIATRLDGLPWQAPSALSLTDSLRAGDQLQITERSADSVIGLRIGDDRGYWRLRLPDSPAGGGRGRLRLRYRGQADGDLRLGALLRGESQPRRLAQARRVRAGAWEDLEFDLDGPGIAGLEVEAWTLHAPQSEVQPVTLRELSWLPSSPLLAGSHQVDGILRRAHALPAGHALEWALPRELGASIELAIAAHPQRSPRGPFEIYASMICQKGSHPLWARRLDSREAKWLQLRLTPAPCEETAHRLRVEREDGDEPDRFALVTPPRIPDPSDARPNVLLIVIDTLRADGLSGFGGARATSPELDELLRESVRFENAYATASWTHPSTASILSGLLPHQHGLGLASGGLSHFRAGVSLLAERLRDSGYATAAVSNNLIVSGAEGFARGYDSFDARPLLAPQYHGAMRVSRGAWQWLEGRQAPFHLYLHYFDPHDRYQAPPPWTDHFVEHDPSPLPLDIREGRLHGLLSRMYEKGRPTGVLPGPLEMQHLRALYDGEIRYGDRWISWLLQRMRETGQLENTLIVLTSDHGEEFLEHGRLKHGHALYEELVRVPLAIRFPDGIGRSVTTPVSLIDLLPTVLAACDLHDPSLSGRDLAVELSPVPVYALAPAGAGVGDTPAHGTLQMLRDGDWKLIRQLDPPRLELFDLAADPSELHNLIETKDASKWISLLDQSFGDLHSIGFDESELDPATLEKLRALGYAH